MRKTLRLVGDSNGQVQHAVMSSIVLCECPQMHQLHCSLSHRFGVRVLVDALQLCAQFSLSHVILIVAGRFADRMTDGISQAL